MNPTALIESGILVNYCLGFCTPEEVLQIENFAAIHPEIQNEINSIQHTLEEQLMKNAIKPSANVKAGIMRSVYKQQAADQTGFVPLIENNNDVEELKKWVACNDIKLPTADFENLFITELASTNEVINFIVAAKKGHETEVHEDFIEYLFVISGSCTMDFEGIKKAYVAGDIISIPPKVNHTAVVTSAAPMLALVQRQKI